MITNNEYLINIAFDYAFFILMIIVTVISKRNKPSLFKRESIYINIIVGFSFLSIMPPDYKVTIFNPLWMFICWALVKYKQAGKGTCVSDIFLGSFMVYPIMKITEGLVTNGWFQLVFRPFYLM